MNGAWPDGEKTVTGAPRVLVVEDEPNIRELVCLHLGLDGYACEGAGDGQAALARTEADAFDLLVLDVMLPGLDGVSLCRAVRRGTMNHDVPILMTRYVLESLTPQQAVELSGKVVNCGMTVYRRGESGLALDVFNDATPVEEDADAAVTAHE